MTQESAKKTRRPRPLTGLYVLVVDDDEKTREFFRVVLTYYGAAVSTAPTSRTALDALQRHAPDVVLTDVVLREPEDGMWLIREAQDRWPWLRFIVVSGQDVQTDVLTTSGFAMYVRKPVAAELLVDAVLASVASD